MLRATTACTFSTSQLPKVVRQWCFVHFDLEMWLRATTACNCSSLIWPAGSAPAALASLLFDPPEPQIIGKTQFRDFPTFSRICIFFLLTLLSSNLSLLSASSLLCFSSVHIVGSLTSKLPSIITLHYTNYTTATTATTATTTATTTITLNCTTLHYTNYTAAHYKYNYKYTILHNTTLH